MKKISFGSGIDKTIGAIMFVVLLLIIYNQVNKITKENQVSRGGIYVATE